MLFSAANMDWISLNKYFGVRNDYGKNYMQRRSMLRALQWQRLSENDSIFQKFKGLIHTGSDKCRKEDKKRSERVFALLVLPHKITARHIDLRKLIAQSKTYRFATDLQSCVSAHNVATLFSYSPQREMWRFGIAEQEKTAKHSFFTFLRKKLCVCGFLLLRNSKSPLFALWRVRRKSCDIECADIRLQIDIFGFAQ